MYRSFCFTRSSRPPRRLLWSTSHMCVAQQSLAMCQQCYLPCPRAEDHSGELASTGKPMSAVIRYKRLEDKYHQHGLQIELKVFPPPSVFPVWKISDWSRQTQLQQSFKVRSSSVFIFLYFCSGTRSMTLVFSLF